MLGFRYGYNRTGIPAVCRVSPLFGGPSRVRAMDLHTSDTVWTLQIQCETPRLPLLRYLRRREKHDIVQHWSDVCLPFELVLVLYEISQLALHPNEPTFHDRPTL